MNRTEPEPDHPQMRPIGVLAVQGSFDLHLESLRRIDVPGRKVRHPHDLAGLGGLIIPGGESTVISGVARERGLLVAIRESANAGLAMLGTCAGAILLGEGPELLGEGRESPERLGLAPVVVERNAYGRQVDSFETDLLLRPFESPFRGIFIRAPRFHLSRDHDRSGVEILGSHGEDPVFLRYGRILLATFHPELTDDTRVHEYFVSEVCEEKARSGASR